MSARSKAYEVAAIASSPVKISLSLNKGSHV
jgi:hypothetical protein